jgi:hypothetical protein
MRKNALFFLCFTLLLCLRLPATAGQGPSPGAPAVATEHTRVCHGFVVKQDKLANKVSNATSYSTQLKWARRYTDERLARIGRHEKCTATDSDLLRALDDYAWKILGDEATYRAELAARHANRMAKLRRALNGAACGAANTPAPTGPEGAGGGISRTAQGVTACQDKMR